jgi:Tol biopolymer transport system component
MDIWTVERGHPDTFRTMVATAAEDGGPTFSLDGQYLAYHSDQSRRFEIYVRPLLEGSESRQVSASGGRDAVWTRSGEIFYRS